MKHDISFQTEKHDGQDCQVYRVDGFPHEVVIKVLTGDIRDLCYPRTKNLMLSKESFSENRDLLSETVQILCRDVVIATHNESLRNKLKPLYLFGVDEFYEFIKDAS
jgi:hypothetical protein